MSTTPDAPAPFTPSFEDRTAPTPKTKTLRARLWTGVDAESHVLPQEFQDELETIRDEYYARHPPASPEARCLLDQIIMCEWHLRRFFTADDSLWLEFHAGTSANDDPYALAARKGAGPFSALQHRINSTRRALHNALRERERLEARDRDVEVVRPDPATDSVISTPSKHLQILGSLRK
jgi:hypothetical protein